ncbi:DNA gyrase subunit A [candidate division CSSED10-310 bacterium]|uniref:DNA gyrase subunit A n=1 Tax=candidate division CSSED10-310 bacterium TaxID=2855610 RepID=A0ABV6YWG5_UNCC1
MSDQNNTMAIDIEDELKSSFLDYAMSVIVARALPDVRDGLKPVHRRIVYTLHDLNLTPEKKYRKCAKICGDVSGNYHPHGESIIYPSLVRMAQDFAMRYPLVKGQGNFGSIDGDPPAAMRYTEAKMTKLTQELLLNIEKNTVDFVPNYDDTRHEPVVLPTVIPNLLINGSSGIAVGMATNIPPHNIGEIIDALIHLIDNPQATIMDLLNFVTGPDFPTGGIIQGREGFIKAYHTGRGSIVMLANASIEKVTKTGRERIIVTEIPYQVNKTNLITAIANHVKNKKIEGIADLRDESDREGLRIVIDLKKNENPHVVLNNLHKYTQMRQSFGITLLALDGGEPKLMNLKSMLVAFINHRIEVVTRRTQFELDNSLRRAHILEGYKKALAFIDEVIELIKTSQSVSDAQQKLIARFEFSEIQAKAILELRLQRLTGLEQEKIEQEYLRLIKEINRLQAILDSQSLLMEVIKEELLKIRENYNDPRKSVIVADVEEIELEDLIAEEDMVIFVTHEGYIKRNSLSLYRSQHRKGQGITGIIPKEGDFVERLFIASTHDYILIFTNKGRIHWLKVHQIPQVGRTSKGKAIVNLLEFGPHEKVTTLFPVRNFSDGTYLIMATKMGVIKKTALVAYSNPRSGGIIALNLDEGDELISVSMTDGYKDIFIATRNGLAIKFDEENVRSIGRVGRGVKGIKLSPDDFVIGMEVIDQNSSILTVTENGYGKRTSQDQYRKQGRGGRGIINIRTSERNGQVVGILQVNEGDNVILITHDGKLIRFFISEESLRLIGRATQGVLLQALQPSDKVVAAAKLFDENHED